MTRLASAFRKGRPALVCFITAGDGRYPANPCGSCDKDIFTVAEHLGVKP